MHRYRWLAASFVLACACAPPVQPNVLLVTIDTLRADALGAYGARPSPSPWLDALAAESTVFEYALSPMPMTRPAHFSLFTSRYPREHGVVNNRISLPSDELTLAEILRSDGYRTGAFVSVGLLSDDSGVEQGFEVLDSPSGKQRPADEAIDRALEWIRALGPGDPFFAWVHLFDPHQPYGLPDAQLGKVDPAMLEVLPQIEWADLYRVAEQNGGDIPKAVLDHALALYRAEVAYADQQVGRLLDGLASVRDLDDVIIVVTADHGECFESGVYFEHADCLNQSSLRVPLIVRHPQTFAPGARVRTPVSLLDVAPSLLDAAGSAPQQGFTGILLQQPGDGDRRLLVQHPFYQEGAVRNRLQKRQSIKTVAGAPVVPVVVNAERVGVVDREWRYLRSGSAEELYRLGADPDETINRAHDEERVRESFAGSLDTLLERHPLELIDPGVINDELRATLEALGYVQ